MSDPVISLREYLDREIVAVRRELNTMATGVLETAKAHSESHAREHNMTNTALSKAEEAMTIRLGQMNEFREQIVAERQTYVTRSELTEIKQRLEELVSRNDGRLTKVESFVISTIAQLGTLRALMAAVLFAMAVAGFVLQQSR